MSPKEPLIIILFLTALTVILLRLLRKVRKRNPDLFVHFYLGAIAVKLILSLALLVVLLVRQPSQAVLNSITFLVMYAFATGIEVIVLLPRKGTS